MLISPWSIRSLVALAAGLDLLDVGVDLGLLDGEVVDRDPGVARLVVELGAGRRAARRARRSSGSVRALVAQLVGARVELLEVEQLQLGGRVGFQRVLLLGLGVVMTRGTATGRCRAC